MLNVFLAIIIIVSPNGEIKTLNSTIVDSTRQECIYTADRIASEIQVPEGYVKWTVCSKINNTKHL